MPPVEETVQEAAGEAAVVVAETPVAKTFAEVEAEYRANYDKSLGRDVSQFTTAKEKIRAGQAPVPVAKVAEKPVEKAAEKTAETVVEGEKKVEVKAAVVEMPKKRSGIARLKATNYRQGEEIRVLQSRLEALEKGGVKADVKTEATAEDDVEPTADKFENTNDFVKALREFDKKQRDKEAGKLRQEIDAAAQSEEWNDKVAAYKVEVEKVKSKYPDWDEKLKTDVLVGRAGKTGDQASLDAARDYNAVMTGVLLAAGPEVVYDLVSAPKQAKALSGIEINSWLAISHSDDVAGVVRYITAHVEEIDKLNGLNPVKAEVYIGKLEARVEAEAASAAKAQAEKAAKEQKQTATGETGQPKVAAATVVQKAIPKAKPEPPPELKGGAPSSSTWTDPANMSMAERERLMQEDPRFKKLR